MITLFEPRKFDIDPVTTTLNHPLGGWEDDLLFLMNCSGWGGPHQFPPVKNAGGFGCANFLDAAWRKNGENMDGWETDQLPKPHQLPNRPELLDFNSIKLSAMDDFSLRYTTTIYQSPLSLLDSTTSSEISCRKREVFVNPLDHRAPKKGVSEVIKSSQLTLW